MLSKAAWGVESEGFLLTVIALIFATLLFYAVPSAGLLFRGGDTIPKIFLGLAMLTLSTHLCWRWALARLVLPLRAESSSSLVFKGGCSWPGLHCVGSFPGIQLMKFGLLLSHSCSSFMIWLLLKCVGISEIRCLCASISEIWGVRVKPEEVVTKKCVQVYFQFTSILSFCSCWGWAVWFRAGESSCFAVQIWW